MEHFNYDDYVHISLKKKVLHKTVNVFETYLMVFNNLISHKGFLPDNMWIHTTTFLYKNSFIKRLLHKSVKANVSHMKSYSYFKIIFAKYRISSLVKFHINVLYTACTHMYYFRVSKFTQSEIFLCFHTNFMQNP